jgi:hypothetical protein
MARHRFCTWGRRPLWLAASILAVTHAIHPSTIVLSPSLLYLGWLAFARGRLQGRRQAGGLDVTLQIALPMMLVAGATVILMEQGGHGISALLTSDRPGGGDARWLVPLWETTTRWEQYTLFSWLHLRDFINEQLLVAPVVLPSLLIIWRLCHCPSHPSFTLASLSPLHLVTFLPPARRPPLPALHVALESRLWWPTRLGSVQFGGVAFNALACGDDADCAVQPLVSCDGRFTAHSGTIAAHGSLGLPKYVAMVMAVASRMCDGMGYSWVARA